MQPDNNSDSGFSFANIPTGWLIAGGCGLILTCVVVVMIGAIIIFIARFDQGGETLTMPPPPTPLVTAVSTSTSSPAATVTLAGNNLDDHIKAVRLASAPTIDGNLVEWGEIPPFTAPFIVEQEASWDGTMDVETSWRLGWDDQNLYLAVAISDDVHVQTKEPKFAYLGDSLELQFDTNIEADYGSGVNNDDYQYIVSPGNFADKNPGSFRFRGDDQGVMGDFIGSGARVAALKTNEGYNVEVSIPWSDLGVQPSPNLVLGAAFSVNDLDTPGTAVQELMLSHVPTRRWLDPSSWGSLELEP